MAAIHNAAYVIDRFFMCYSRVTRAECDELAISLVESLVTPAVIQGGVSYTLLGGPMKEKIVHFRPESSKLVEDMERAQGIQGYRGADCKLRGSLGTRPCRLMVYVIQRLHGVTYFENEDFKDCSDDDLARRSHTIRELATFFAQSWTRKQERPESILRELGRYRKHRRDVIISHMPSRFIPLFNLLRDEIDFMYLVSSYPLIPTHQDPCKMNILIDPDTGCITGIIDWADPSLEPFGFALWGLENLLGCEDGSGWHYYLESEDLRKLFWSTFEETVTTLTDAEKHNIYFARMLGLILGFGISWKHRKDEKAINEPVMKWLDEFCLQPPQQFAKLYRSPE